MASAIRNYGWRMNEAIAFDIHRFVKRLAESGFHRKSNPPAFNYTWEVSEPIGDSGGL